jgi:penicillin-binding protein 1A
MEKLRPQLEDWCEDHTKEDKTVYNLYTDGLKIRTTINFDMQIDAEKAVAEQMKNLQNSFNEHWGNKSPWGKDQSVLMRAMKRSDRYRNLKNKGLSDEEIKAAFEKPVSVSLW